MSKVAKRLEVREEVIGYRAVNDALGDTIIVLNKQGEPQTYVLSEPRQASKTAPAGQEYVDPYLFETEYFASRKEYEELTRTARIIPRASA